ncbi:site-specific integrase [Pseudomonas aeruginosa]|uniref:site-specific integrase n=1 Tax=Pseudomonas aeruginosa TaxID=287 RepID=UPI00071C099B|nr:site-specific integrase [Pseudomonas aeruginosa]KSQ40153.1 site-specific integrase [Pseudomonas aeruginosa]RPV69882.1 site-specific integrase [Pseudomonas aeruginosa]HBO9199652.1 tyrosine-type recombinase/integrase [Pseudomonas aeruginosa]
MGRKPRTLPTGIEVVQGKYVRIRFTWHTRRCETLAYPPTAKGIAEADRLRTQVVQLIKLGVMTEEKYAELFPDSSYVKSASIPTFGEYAQIWLDSREIVETTRSNYKGTLNRYWMPYLAEARIDLVSAADVRRIVANTEWSSAGVRRNAVDKLSSIFKSALADGLINRNPCASIARPRLAKKQVDPYERDDAERIIGYLYETCRGLTEIYAAWFEFAFFTGMRPAEQAALRWADIDMGKQTAHVWRGRVKGKVFERVKTKEERTVLLNSRAMHALRVAERLTKLRSEYVFAPADGNSYIKSDSTTRDYLLKALVKLKIRRRRQYDTRHTYATMCLMAGMNPAFIANQLGHSVQMLLSTYAKWMNSDADRAELDKLDRFAIGTKVVHKA